MVSTASSQERLGKSAMRRKMPGRNKELENREKNRKKILRCEIIIENCVA